MDREAFAELLPEKAPYNLISWVRETQSGELGGSAYTVYRCERAAGEASIQINLTVKECFHCYVSPGDGRVEAETEFFDGKAPSFVEGYRYVPSGYTWTREDGVEFQGEMVAPWKSWAELDSIQRAYEREQYSDLITKLSEVYEEDAGT